ncbi:YjfB family protein [Paenibacillus sp. GYB003]|uniref:YjfB family protein n=1 Tax=Paenibacillus sp. GYB003 TaxID=2994392 RepID=UPI002F96DDF3
MSVSLNAAYSQFSKSDLPLAVGIAMLSKAKESAEAQGAQMVQMLQQSVQPHLGGKLDIRA